MDKKFETLADFYKGFQPFRVSMKTMYSIRTRFLNNMSSDFYAERNDEEVEFCRGVVFTAYCLGYIDSWTFRYFCDVLIRYKSFYYK